ncbi:MAG: aminopeptidase P family protein [Sedimentisphaerales bacterium]|nr:aminopeptidase P family protein [Sedimentisphaerales bacterium]
MTQVKADCLIVTKSANVTYITGFSGEDSWAIVMPKGVSLVTDSRYSEQARQECKRCRIIVRKKGMVKTIAEMLQNRRGMRIAVEKSASIAEFEQLKKCLPGRLKAIGNIVETVRRTKDESEIAAIREAARIAARAFENTRRQIKHGMTENELAGILDLEIRKSGGQHAFETIAAFGANASRPHHRPTSRKLRKNDTVLIDFGVRFNGYCCDITRCFTSGKISRLYYRVYKAVQKAQAAALKEIKAGVEITKVDSAARTVIKKSGLPVYGHGTGHGLGLEVHEMPSLSPKTEGTLQAGNVITIEPGVYMPGKLGVRIEDDVLVTEKGPVLLSKIPKNLE